MVGMVWRISESEVVIAWQRTAAAAFGPETAVVDPMSMGYGL
jgi:hypothetical protein